jgi:subtilisin family serine protease
MFLCCSPVALGQSLRVDDTKDPLTVVYTHQVADIIHIWDRSLKEAGFRESAIRAVDQILSPSRTFHTTDAIELWVSFRSAPESYGKDLERLGIDTRDDHFYVLGNNVQMVVPLSSISKLAEVPGVLRVDLPPVTIPDAIVSQGLGRVHASNFLNSGYTGSGVKVAILDLGFSGYQNFVGTELPSNVTVKSFYNSVNGNGDITGGGEVHGTACAEIVHDMAPDAQLFLVNYRTVGEQSAALDYLISAGVKIISHSAVGFNYSIYDGTGEESAMAVRAKNNGILWVNASGNQAEGHWEGYFLDQNSNSWNNFSSGDDDINITLSSGLTYSFNLDWDDWQNANNDYDLYLFNDSGSQVAASKDLQIGTFFGSKPVESFYYTPPSTGTYHIRIKRPLSAATNLKFEFFVTPGSLSEYRVLSSSMGDPAPSASSFTVGAMAYDSNSIETYSSRGPTTDGRTKPNITGPDHVSTATYSTFNGTSAATPHVAGAAAEVLSKSPSMTPDQLISFLTTNAVDYGSSGTDNTYGSGMLNLPPQLSVSWTTPPPASITAGQQFTVAWSVTGTPDHINVHWNPTDPTASGCCLGPDNSTNNSTFSPTASPFVLVAPTLNQNGTPITSATTTKYVVHAHDAGGTTVYSSVVTMTILPPNIDSTPPDTTITGGPSGTISTGTAAFSWTGTDNVTSTASLVYAYRLAPVEGSFSSFSGATSHTYTSLANGTYTFYVKARDQAGNEDPTPAAQTFTVSINNQPPDATTNAATDITQTSAFLNSTVNPRGLSTSVVFEYGQSTSYGNVTGSAGIGSGSSPVPVSSSIGGLSCNTAYHFRVRATSSGGTSYGDDRSFITQQCSGSDTTPPNTTILSGPPSTVSTGDASFSWTGTDNVTPSSSLTYAYRLDPQDASFSSFTSSTSASYSNLPDGNYTFYVKARDQAGNEDPSPAALAFTVARLVGAPFATTRSASNISATSAYLNATVNPHGSNTTVAMEYGTTPSYGLTAAPIDIGSGTSDVQLAFGVIQLSCETVYHFRVRATNSYGIAYGADLSFVTGACDGNDVQLFSGVSVAGSIFGSSVQSSWNYYYINVPAGTSHMDVLLDGLSGDVDLYTRFGAKPDLANYSCRPYIDGLFSELCSFDNPEPGIWWIGVNNFAVGSMGYTVTATLEQSTGNFFTLTPCRLYDTRDWNAAIGSNSGEQLWLVGSCGIPSTAKALSLNVTVTNPTAAGFLSVYSDIGLPPTTSTINFLPGQTRANNTIAKLTQFGSVAVFCGMSEEGHVDYILDVNGYFE